MRLKHLLILLFAIGIAMPLKAQDSHFIAGWGFSKQTSTFRLGFIPETVGGEILVKCDNNRLFKDIPGMEGRRHRFSLMGGVNLNLADLMVLTANVGYGSTGTYRTAATGDQYGVENLTRGFEAGFSVDIAVGIFTVFGGWSRIFATPPVTANEDDAPKLSEFMIGVGLFL